MRRIFAVLLFTLALTNLFGDSTVLHAESAVPDSVAPSVSAAPETFADLLSGFRESPGFEARFEEEKFLALLAAPLRSSGRLYFEPPGTLLRRVELPHPQDILVAENQVRISDGSTEQVLDLSARAEVRPLVESMIWIFTGDIESLERTYRVFYEGVDSADRGLGSGIGESSKPARWQARLVPRDTPLSDLMSELRVSGSGFAADTIELIERAGDRTLTRVLDVNPRRRFDDAERRALFGAQ